jgi:hypothetical protein
MEVAGCIGNGCLRQVGINAVELDGSGRDGRAGLVLYGSANAAQI